MAPSDSLPLNSLPPSSPPSDPPTPRPIAELPIDERICLLQNYGLRSRFTDSESAYESENRGSGEVQVFDYSVDLVEAGDHNPGDDGHVTERGQDTVFEVPLDSNSRFLPKPWPKTGHTSHLRVANFPCNDKNSYEDVFLEGTKEMIWKRMEEKIVLNFENELNTGPADFHKRTKEWGRRIEEWKGKKGWWEEKVSRWEKEKNDEIQKGGGVQDDEGGPREMVEQKMREKMEEELLAGVKEGLQKRERGKLWEGMKNFDEILKAGNLPTLKSSTPVRFSASEKDKTLVFMVSLPYLDLGVDGEGISLSEYMRLRNDTDIIDDRKGMGGLVSDTGAIGSSKGEEARVYKALFVIIDNDAVAIFRSKDKHSDQPPLFRNQERLGAFRALISIISNILKFPQKRLFNFFDNKVSQQVFEAMECTSKLPSERTRKQSEATLVGVGGSDVEGSDVGGGDVEGGDVGGGGVGGGDVEGGDVGGGDVEGSDVEGSDVGSSDVGGGGGVVDRGRLLISTLQGLDTDISALRRVLRSQIEILEEIRYIYEGTYTEGSSYTEEGSYDRNAVKIPVLWGMEEQIHPAIQTINKVIGERKTFDQKFCDLVNEVRISRESLYKFLEIELAISAASQAGFLKSAVEAINKTIPTETARVTGGIIDQTIELKGALSGQTNELKVGLSGQTDGLKEALGGQTDRLKEALGGQTDGLKEVLGGQTDGLKEALNKQTEDITTKSGDVVKGQTNIMLKQQRAMTALMFISMVFLPLSFFASYLGMNIGWKSARPTSEHTFFWAISGPPTFVIVIWTCWADHAFEDRFPTYKKFRDKCTRGREKSVDPEKVGGNTTPGGGTTR